MLGVLFNSLPRRGSLAWAKGGLAQARRSSLKQEFVDCDCCNVLAQASGPSLSDIGWAVWTKAFSLSDVICYWVIKASVNAVSDWMCWNGDTWSTRLLRYLKGQLAGIP